jgi:hypothetical protein
MHPIGIGNAQADRYALYRAALSMTANIAAALSKLS